MPHFPSLTSTQPNQNATVTISGQGGGTSDPKLLKWYKSWTAGCEVCLHYRDLSPASSEYCKSPAKSSLNEAHSGTLCSTVWAGMRRSTSHKDTFKRPFFKVGTVTAQKNTLCLCCFKEKKVIWFVNGTEDGQKGDGSQKAEATEVGKCGAGCVVLLHVLHTQTHLTKKPQCILQQYESYRITECQIGREPQPFQVVV